MVTDEMLNDFFEFVFKVKNQDASDFKDWFAVYESEFEDLNGKYKLFIETDLIAGMSFEEVKNKHREIFIKDANLAGFYDY